MFEKEMLSKIYVIFNTDKVHLALKGATQTYNYFAELFSSWKGVCHKYFEFFSDCDKIFKFRRNPSLCTLPLSQSQCCASHRGDNLHSVYHTAVSISVVCLTLQSHISHRRVKIEIFACLWLLFKGIIRKNFFLDGTRLSWKKRKVLN